MKILAFLYLSLAAHAAPVNFADEANRLPSFVSHSLKTEKDKHGAITHFAEGSEPSLLGHDCAFRFVENDYNVKTEKYDSTSLCVDVGASLWGQLNNKGSQQVCFISADPRAQINVLESGDALDLSAPDASASFHLEKQGRGFVVDAKDANLSLSCQIQ